MVQMVGGKRVLEHDKLVLVGGMAQAREHDMLELVGGSLELVGGSLELVDDSLGLGCDIHRNLLGTVGRKVPPVA